VTGPEETLLRERVIFLDSVIDEDTTNRITAQLLLLEAADPNADVTFYIDSTGGSIAEGMAIYDTMNHITPDVVTIAVQQAGGMAQILLSAGAPGKRCALSQATISLTLPESSSEDDSPLRGVLDNWINEMVQLTVAATGQPADRVLADATQRRTFTAAEAAEYGLIDKVVDVTG
jgi:ATP-dependent Clp protease, protease subunit